ncbi:hypothetical protein F511_39370 [Dorcoceras hygrometricum]|uniref:Uncharacterized protein n=1 Tax=Dorcoceras hygrometricum TaxID=472368 RepID=A0A2Z7CW95_9LAMI|nr:hypothetical protein F511_39370 [Dorcoceras hygrometricum]
MLEYSHAYVQSCLNKLNSYFYPATTSIRSHQGMATTACSNLLPYWLMAKLNKSYMESQIQKLKQIGRTIDQKFTNMLDPSTTSCSLNKPIQSSKLIYTAVWSKAGGAEFLSPRPFVWYHFGDLGRLVEWPELEGLTNLARMESPRRGGRNNSNHEDDGTRRRRKGAAADGSCGRGRGGAQDGG